MSRRGFTLAEVIVAGFIAVAMTGVIIWSFLQFRRGSEQPMATMTMEQSTMQIVRWLQRDLAETNLQTIRTLEGESGVVFESPRDKNDQLKMQDMGVVHWQKHVFFWVNPRTDQPPLPAKVQVGSETITSFGLGELRYDEVFLASPGGGAVVGLEPAAPTGTFVALNGPPSGADPERTKVLGRNFLVNKTANLRGLAVFWRDANGAPQPFANNGAPGTVTRGEPVVVQMTFLDISPSTGQPTVRQLELVVKPKN